MVSSSWIVAKYGIQDPSRSNSVDAFTAYDWNFLSSGIWQFCYDVNKATRCRSFSYFDDEAISDIEPELVLIRLS